MGEGGLFLILRVVQMAFLQYHSTTRPHLCQAGRICVMRRYREIIIDRHPPYYLRHTHFHFRHPHCHFRHTGFHFRHHHYNFGHPHYHFGPPHYHCLHPHHGRCLNHPHDHHGQYRAVALLRLTWRDEESAETERRMLEREVTFDQTSF